MNPTHSPQLSAVPNGPARVVRLPVNGTATEWHAYRMLLYRKVASGEITDAENRRLRSESWQMELAGPAPPPVPTSRYYPTAGSPIELTGARIRQAAVLVIRGRPASDLAMVTWALNRRGFVVAGVRPREVLRKALAAELVGVVGRGPTLRMADGKYTYIEGSLNGRTRRRWEFLFPTLALHRIR
jgi:hypothetical protein